MEFFNYPIFPASISKAGVHGLATHSGSVSPRDVTLSGRRCSSRTATMDIGTREFKSAPCEPRSRKPGIPIAHRGNVNGPSLQRCSNPRIEAAARLMPHEVFLGFSFRCSYQLSVSRSALPLARVIAELSPIAGSEAHIRDSFERN
jgi:hypothetical protein